MAVAFPSSSSAQGTGNVTINAPSGLVDGDVLVAYILTNQGSGSAVYAAPDGWTQFLSDPLMAGFWRVAKGEPASWAFSTDQTTATVFGTVVRVTGADVFPIADVGSSTSAAGTPLVLPSVNAVSGGALLEMVGCSQGTTNSYTPPASSTSLYSTFASGSEQSGAYETPTTSGATGTRTWTNSTTVLNKGMIVAINPAQPTGTEAPSVASQVLSTNTSGTSISATAPSGLQSGDLIVVYTDHNAAANVWSAPDTTWTRWQPTSTNAVFWKIATGSEPPSWTFTRGGLSASNKALAVRVINHRGVDVMQTIGRGTTSAIAFASMNAAAANSLALYATDSFNGGNPWTSPAGVTEIYDTVDGVFAWEVLPSSGASTARTFTPSASCNASGGALVIRPGVGGVAAANGSVKITYQASNTFTCPAGVTSARVQCEGAGGPGGNGSSTARGGGGGGGAYAEEPTLTLVPGRTYAVTVPGTASTVGTAGGAAQFVDNVTSTVLVKAAGGSAGGNGALAGGTGGAGGTTANSVGSITTAGTTGANGGSGGAGAPPLGGAGGTTTPGVAPGGGGGGGSILSGAGQAGAKGVVIITFNYATDTITTGDTAQLVVSWQRSQNESVAAVDAIAKLVVKPMSDSVGVTEIPAKLVLKKPNDETITASDAISRVISFMLTENLSATDFESMFIQRALAENITVAESFTQFLKTTYAETLTTSDGVRQYLQRPNSDNLTATDVAVVVLQYLRYFNDAVTTADVISKYLSLPQADAVAVVDEAMKLMVKKFSADVAMVSDSVVVQAVYHRVFGDSAITSDSFSKSIRLGMQDSISGSVATAPAARRIFAILSD